MTCIEPASLPPSSPHSPPSSSHHSCTTSSSHSILPSSHQSPLHSSHHSRTPVSQCSHPTSSHFLSSTQMRNHLYTRVMTCFPMTISSIIGMTQVMKIQTTLLLIHGCANNSLLWQQQWHQYCHQHRHWQRQYHKHRH